MDFLGRSDSEASLDVFRNKYGEFVVCPKCKSKMTQELDDNLRLFEVCGGCGFKSKVLFCWFDVDGGQRQIQKPELANDNILNCKQHSENFIIEKAISNEFTPFATGCWRDEPECESRVFAIIVRRQPGI